jgi:hypothetical protein
MHLSEPEHPFAIRGPMDWKVEYISDQGIVQATISGTVTFSGEMGLAFDLAGCLCDAGAKKYLLDYRSAQVDTDVVDIFSIVRYVERLGAAPDSLPAFLLAAHTRGKLAFAQSQWRRPRFHLFGDVRAAMHWLAQRG